MCINDIIDTIRVRLNPTAEIEFSADIILAAAVNSAGMHWRSGQEVAEFIAAQAGASVRLTIDGFRFRNAERTGSALENQN